MPTTCDPAGRTAVARRSHRYDPPVMVGVLGTLRVERDGVVVGLPRRMERRLLTALAASHPHEVTVDALLDALWGETPPVSARKTLQTNVLRLRQLLGADTIVTTADGYRLGPGVCVDAVEFERTGDLASVARRAVRRPPGVDGRRGAGGPASSSCTDGAEDTAVESLLDAGRATDAVAELERLVADDPAREVRWTLLVRALVVAERRPEALRAFERARRTLAAELGITPGAGAGCGPSAALDDEVLDTAPAVRR